MLRTKWTTGVSFLIRRSSETVVDPITERWRELNSALPTTSRLLAVSKGHPAKVIRRIAVLGQRAFGESRLQEALPKQQELIDLPLQWHFIGRLQSNKVRGVVRAFSVIHSVDSWTLADRLSRICQEEARDPEVYLQVKFREDPTKGGWNPTELVDHWSRLIALPGLRIRGLMTMAPQGLSMPERRDLFQSCSELADQLALPERSMGMSGDWTEAAAAGSTWLRLGSALFGPRPAVSAG